MKHCVGFQGWFWDWLVKVTRVFVNWTFVYNQIMKIEFFEVCESLGNVFDLLFVCEGGRHEISQTSLLLHF